MRTRTAVIAAALAAAACVAVPAAASAAGPSQAGATGSVAAGSVGSSGKIFDYYRGKTLKVVGLSDAGKSLVKFTTNRPERAEKIGSIKGLTGDTALVGIDYRVQNGKLYGVGNSGGIYLLSDRDAKASKVGQLSVPLAGTSFGVDFNPAANALRVVSDTGQNLRQPFATTDGPTAPTVADTPLTYPPAAATGITAAAYTNNDLSADTATTLFDLDTTLDQVVLQSPANAGTLVPTGKLGVDGAPDAGFDIYSTVRRDKTVELDAYATIGVGGSYQLYSINLLTGAADKEGSFKSPVTDIAIPLAQR
jgi:hypothetical protein